MAPEHWPSCDVCGDPVSVSQGVLVLSNRDIAQYEVELEKCSKCGDDTLTKFYEAEHTRIYFCLKCGMQKTEYIRKTIRCNHIFLDEYCMNCGYEKDTKYT